MSIYYQDDTVTLLLGDAGEQVATLAPGSIQTVVTSPPYFGLRDYGVDGQLGAEKSPAEFIANLVDVFEAIRPALADDGVVWVNLGDSYSTYPGNRGASSTGVSKNGRTPSMPKGAGLSGHRPAKNLLGIPWRFAFAMQDAGWILRNDIIWAKPNGMPESVRDRFSAKHEHIFLFSKKPSYYFNLDAVRVPAAKGASGSTFTAGKTAHSQVGASLKDRAESESRNPGDVWTIPTQPYPGAHFAVFPPEIPERCILAGSRAGDTVLDPFSGSGTTGMVAGKHGRRYIGIDLNPEYHDLALKTRLAQGVLG